MSFTLDRYGHLYPESDAALRDRLDALYSATSATRTPPWWTCFRSAHGPSAIQNSGNAGGTRPITVLASMALLTGEDHQGLPTASRLRWGLLLSEP